jgi:phosphatidate phosphatase APP1
MTSLLEEMTHRLRPQSNLTRGDRVVLFPSLGHLAPDGKHWLIDVHGDVFGEGHINLGKRVLLRLLRRAMRAKNEDLAGRIFQDRIARFVASDRPGRRIVLRVGDQLHSLPKRTHRNGHFHASLRISAASAARWAETAAVGSEKYLETEVQGTTALGQAYLIDPQGLSVISDIDDTLKHSHVLCKRTLLTNTFLRPFETIPGMAPLFRRWWAEGAAFHYVSSSPWQLYAHLAEHLAEEGFPTGSFHLRHFRLRDHLLRRLLLLRRSGKLSVIRRIIRRYPDRRFLLVGDSGEHDPEIYGALARRYPRQIAGVFIRQIDSKRSTQRRFAKAFRHVAAENVLLYRDAAELAHICLPACS